MQTAEDKKRTRQKYKLLHPEIIKDRSRKHYVENKEKEIARKRKWGRENPEIVSKANKRHYKRNPEKHRDYHLKVNYGITLEDYKRLSEKQNNRCAICRKEASEGTKALSVDHDHKTGKVRGLLCGNCNTGIGLLQESEKLLLKAILYLEQ